MRNSEFGILEFYGGRGLEFRIPEFRFRYSLKRVEFHELHDNAWPICTNSETTMEFRKSTTTEFPRKNDKSRKAV